MRPVATTASAKSSTNNVLEWIVAWIRVFYYRLMWRYFPSFLLNKKNNSVTPSEAAPAIVLPEDVYKTQRKDRFLAWFRGGAASADANLDAIFTQSYAEYWKEVQVKDNLLEQRWRRRLLIESTPRGNVIMYYDAFKRGFAYYADTFMPYGLLNAVAMKYVMTYSCRSFFVDEAFVDEAFVETNHLIRLEREQDDDDTKKDEKKKDDEKKGGGEIKKMLDGPFIKRAPVEYPTPPCENDIVLQKGLIAGAPEFVQNRFINLGKIVNLKILLTVKAASFVNPSTTGSSSSYKEYKFWQQQHQQLGSASDVFRDMN